VGRLVGASALDVTGLLAAVAHALSGGLRRAVAGQVADLAAYVILVQIISSGGHLLLTVVALLALGAVTAHVAEAAARVAGGLNTKSA
jgi:hypothetical protein